MRTNITTPNVLSKLSSKKETSSPSPIQKIGKGLSDYGKNVAGGAKIVGSAIKDRINRLGMKVADDLFGSKERDIKQKIEAKKLNEEYSGRVRGRSTSTGYMSR